MRRLVLTGIALVLLLTPLVPSHAGDRKDNERYRARRARFNLRAEGGGGTQKDMEAGLRWLANRQSAWAWKAEGDRSKTGTTGLALLAFLGAGETPDSERFGITVKFGLKYLLEEQAPNGDLAPAKAGKPVRDHAIATQVLVHAYALTEEARFRLPAQRAVDRLLALQDQGGGWRPKTGAKPDLETTVWAVAALRCTRKADDLKAGSGYPARVLSFLKKRASNKGASAPTSLLETARSAQTRILLGDEIPDEAAILLKNLPRRNKANPPASDPRYWYFGSHAMFQIGGDSWRDWNLAMKKAVVGHARAEGPDRGSWDPTGPRAKQTGRVTVTAYCTLCLQTYYRYSRVFRSRTGHGGAAKPRKPARGEATEESEGG